MLQMRPGCECCNVDLAPDSTDAWICSFECTFCTSCLNSKLGGVCPNCGGSFFEEAQSHRQGSGKEPGFNGSRFQA